MHHHVSPAHIVFLTWLNTPLTNRVGVTTGLMHYWWNGQVADAGVCGWDQCPSGQRLLSSCSLSHQFFFFLNKISLVPLSWGPHLLQVLWVSSQCVFPRASAWKSRVTHKGKVKKSELWMQRHSSRLQPQTANHHSSHSGAAEQLRDDAFSLRKSKDHTWVTLESKRENQSWEF